LRSGDFEKRERTVDEAQIGNGNDASVEKHTLKSFSIFKLVRQLAGYLIYQFMRNVKVMTQQLGSKIQASR